MLMVFSDQCCDGADGLIIGVERVNSDGGLLLVW